MSKEKRAILVSSVLSDPQASREKRVTGVFLVPQDHTVPKETPVLPVHQVLSVRSVLLDYLVLLVPKELKDHRVKLDQRERLERPDLLDLLDLPAMSSTRSPSSPP